MAAMTPLQRIARMNLSNGDVYEGEVNANEVPPVPHGRGTLKTSQGVLKYDGDWLAGAKTGQGRIYRNGKLLYEGGVVDGELTGHGRSYFADGVTVEYEGGWVQGMRHGGPGVIRCPRGSLLKAAQFIRGAPTGAVTRTWPDGRRLEGIFEDGDIQGPGSFTSADGRREEGVWYCGHNWLQVGPTELVHIDGKRYKGEINGETGHAHGRGEMTFADGERYVGEFAHGEREGRCYWYRANGTLCFDGPFREDFISGSDGRLYADDGVTLKYEGEWLRNQYHGRGTQYFPDGRILRGDFQHAHPHGEIRIEWPANSAGGEVDGRVFEGRAVRGSIKGPGRLTLPDGRVFSGVWSDGGRLRVATNHLVTFDWEYTGDLKKKNNKVDDDNDDDNDADDEDATTTMTGNAIAHGRGEQRTFVKPIRVIEGTWVDGKIQLEAGPIGFSVVGLGSD